MVPPSVQCFWIALGIDDRHNDLCPSSRGVPLWMRPLDVDVRQRLLPDTLLVSILDGASRSFLLRSFIRGLGKKNVDGKEGQ